MRKRRRFYSGVINHIYQKSSDGSNLFYGYEDFLVFYTIFSVCTRSSDVEVLMLCIMFNHFHSLIRTRTVQELSDFMDRVTAWYVMDFNFSVGRKGKLLKKNFGSAPKWKDKDVRSIINYIGNNPVEKYLTSVAETYRWNFLAYIFSKNPFSAPTKRDKASKPMRRALAQVDVSVKMNIPLKYQQLRRIFKSLSTVEVEQLVDYIISEYLPFDTEQLLSYYESYEAMLAAMHSNTGSEHDIREDWYPESDTAFLEMVNYVQRKWPERIARSVIMLSAEEKVVLLEELRRYTTASDRQICRFLHL